MNKEIYDYLDELIPNPKCELNYNKDYELLIANFLKVPNNRKYLESLPGVGRKTTNVVLSNLFNVPCIAVDTHVKRVSERFGISNHDDDVYTVEKKLNKCIPKEKLSKLHHQLVLFGRYHCKAIKPDCSNCKIRKYCKKKS